MARKGKYGLIHFIFDCILVLITGGFWLIYIAIREYRRHP